MWNKQQSIAKRIDLNKKKSLFIQYSSTKTFKLECYKTRINKNVKCPRMLQKMIDLYEKLKCNNKSKIYLQATQI